MQSSRDFGVFRLRFLLLDLDPERDIEQRFKRCRGGVASNMTQRRQLLECNFHNLGVVVIDLKVFRSFGARLRPLNDSIVKLQLLYVRLVQVVFTTDQHDYVTLWR